jgi:hypothetical protein
MSIESLNCPQCGAPLNLKAGQTLAACGYCNSSLRISPAAGMLAGAPPVVSRATEIDPAVVDEVKQRLVLGLTTDAVEYYAKKARVSEEDARVAVAAMKETIGYAPPLSNLGILMFVGTVFISLLGVFGGIWLIAGDLGLFGLILILAALAFAVLNGLALSRGLPAYLLERRGTAAKAKILKMWLINTMMVPGTAGKVKLVRMLLDVAPPQGTAFQAEANCMVKESSEPNFSVGCTIEVKFDVRKRVVVTGPKAES